MPSTNDSFVDRYIPGYHFFGDGIIAGGSDPTSGSALHPPWLSSTERGDRPAGFLLRVTIGEERQVVQVTMR